MPRLTPEDLERLRRMRPPEPGPEPDEGEDLLRGWQPPRGVVGRLGRRILDPIGERALQENVIAQALPEGLDAASVRYLEPTSQEFMKGVKSVAESPTWGDIMFPPGPGFGRPEPAGPALRAGHPIMRFGRDAPETRLIREQEPQWEQIQAGFADPVGWIPPVAVARRAGMLGRGGARLLGRATAPKLAETISEPLAREPLALPGAKPRPAVAAPKAPPPGLEITERQMLVTIVTPENPSGTVALVQNNNATRQVLSEFGMGGRTGVDIHSGLLSPEEASEAWLRIYQPEAVGREYPLVGGPTRWGEGGGYRQRAFIEDPKGLAYSRRQVDIQAQQTRVNQAIKNQADTQRELDALRAKTRPTKADRARMKFLRGQATTHRKTHDRAAKRLDDLKKAVEEPTDDPYQVIADLPGARLLSPQERTRALESGVGRVGEPGRPGLAGQVAELPTAPPTPAAAAPGARAAAAPPTPGAAAPDAGAVPSGADVVFNPMEPFGVDSAWASWSKQARAWHPMVEAVFGKVGRVLGRTETAGQINMAKRVQDMVSSNAESFANTAVRGIRLGMKRAGFIENEKGHILNPELANRVVVEEGPNPVVLQHPTIVDIAARMDTYDQFLTPAQRDFMKEQYALVETGVTRTIGGTTVKTNKGINTILREGVKNWNAERIRPDIEHGGFYLTRGYAKFADGREHTIGDELASLLEPPRVEGRPPHLAAEKEAQRSAMGLLVTAKTDVRTGRTVYVPKPSDVTYERYDKTMQRYITGVADRVADTKLEAKIKGMVKGREGPRKITRRETKIKIPYMTDVSVTDDFARALEREFNETVITKVAKSKVAKHVNSIYRGVKSTWDLSAIGIHGQNAVYRTPDVWAHAAQISMRAFLRGRGFADEAMAVVDEHAIAQGLPTSDVLAAKGLRQGGTGYEVAMPFVETLAEKGPLGVRQTAGLFERSNVAFGVFGDLLRFEWAQMMIRQEVARGRTVRELLEAPGAVEEIVSIANKMTGWSDTTFAGDVGQLALFAPRFLQARMETAGQALLGAARMRPPTGEALRRVPGQLASARRALDLRDPGTWNPWERKHWRWLQLHPRAMLPEMGGRWGGVPGGTTPVVESEVLASMGRAQTIQSREAMHSITRMIGWGVMLTEVVNAAVGHETDRRLFVNGKVNSNFYNIRAGGQEFNLFGPQIGLLRAIGLTLTGEWRQALRGLGSGWMRLWWDTWTGYTYMGADAPLGIVRGITKRARPETPGPGFGTTDPKTLATYLLDLVSPIAPGAVGEQLLGSAQEVQAAREGVPGAVERAVTGVAAVPWALVGGRGGPVSRGDWQEDVTRELHPEVGLYADLNANAKMYVDDVVTERHGEQEFRGPRGQLYAEKKGYDDALIQAMQDVADKHLSAPVQSTQYNPMLAREAITAAREIHRTARYGTWNANKQRLTGGVYEALYDRDEIEEEPDPNEDPKAHLMWRYNRVFDAATDASGKIDWDIFDKESSAFWASLVDEGQVETVLANIRVLEGKFPEPVKALLSAGRYAGGLELAIRGQVGTYYDLEDHPEVLSFIAQEAGVRPRYVKQYMDKTYAERRGEQKGPAGAELQRALDKANAKNGILRQVQKEFVAQAPEEWIWAMFDADRKYQDGESVYKGILAGLRSGELTRPRHLDSAGYERLYRQTLGGD